MELEINVFFMLVDVEYHVKGNCCAVCHTTTILMALRSCKQHLCCPGCRVRRYSITSKVKYADDMSQVLPRLSIVDMLPHVRDVCAEPSIVSSFDSSSKEESNSLDSRPGAN